MAASKPARASTKAPALYEKFQTFAQELRTPFVEKDEDAKLITLSLLARQHTAQIGGPGQAKSMLAERAVELIEGATIFNVQFFKGTTVEEVFGPVDFAGLKAGHYRRNIDRYLPTAHVAFMDEMWKASSMVLNSALRVINERTFQNNGTLVECPLVSCVIASNELPEPGEVELAAMRDRILTTRVTEAPRAEQSRLEMLSGFLARGGGALDTQPVVTVDDLTTANAQVRKVAVPTEVKAALTQLWRKAEEAGLSVSPRRFLNGVTLLQANAWLQGRKELLPDDLTLYQHILWLDPDDRSQAHAVTMEFASEFEKSAAKLRGEYEDVLPQVTQMRGMLAETPPNTAEIAPLAAQINATLKGVSERVRTERERADEMNRDPAPFDALLNEIASVRDFAQKEGLGLD